MNKIYRLVWNPSLQMLIAVSEFGKAKGKGKSVAATTAGVVGALALSMVGMEDARAYMAGGATTDSGLAINIAIGSGASAAPVPTPTPETTWGGNIAIGRAATAGDGRVAGSTTSQSGGSVAIGDITVATGVKSTAIGYQANALGNWSMALGTSAKTTGQSAVAIGDYAQGNGANSYAMGPYAVANGAYSNAIGYLSLAKGIDSVAIGHSSLADKDYTVALGVSAAANNVSDIAIGRGAQATGTGSGGAYANRTGAIAIGEGTIASAGNSFALGNDAQATKDNSIAIGQMVNSNGIASVAMGGGSNATGDYSLAHGFWAVASGTDSVAIGDHTKAVGINGVAMGTKSQANGTNSISIGTGNIVNGNNSAAIGDPSIINGTGSYSLGNSNLIDSDNVFVVGSNVNVGTGLNDSIVLGNNSTIAAAVGTASKTIGDSTFTFAGATPVAAMSVGAAGAERTITNVAAGRLESNSTDAINGSQLYAVAADLDASKTHYYSVNDGGVNKANYANDGATGLDSVAVGIGARSAGQNSVAMGIGSLSAGLSSMALGQGSKADGESSLALGTGASATVAKGIALGAGSVASTDFGHAGYVPAGVSAAAQTAINATTSTLAALSVGDASTGNFRQITGVAAGTAGSDAVNVAQLSSVAEMANAGWDVTDASGTSANIGPKGKVIFQSADNNIAVTQSGADDAGVMNFALNKNLDLTSTGSMTIGNSLLNDNGLTLTNGPKVLVTGIDAGSKKIINVTAGVDDTDAVNVSQLKTSADAVKTHYYSVNSTENIEGSNYNNDGATGANAMAAGARAAASGVDSVAMGYGAKALNAGDVALGSGSVTGTTEGTSSVTVNGHTFGDFAGASPTSQVSVGNTDNKRLITNVAAGHVTADSTDAVNGSQLYTAFDAIDGLSQDALLWDPSANAFSAKHGTVAKNKITNVANGDVNSTSSDAINGSQLYKIAGNTTNEYTDEYGVGIRYARTNEAGLEELDSYAMGQGSTALGYKAQSSGLNSLAMGRDSSATANNSVALGANSTTLANLSLAGYNPSTTAVIAGLGPVGEVSIGSAGQERRITNVAAGASDTDAVNVSQLKAVQAGAEASQTHYYSMSSANRSTGSNYNNDGATGSNSMAAGVSAAASGNNAVAVGTGSTATASNSIAIGTGAQAVTASSVALGDGAKTKTAIGLDHMTIRGVDYEVQGKNPVGTVSVGDENAERTITNVAAGQVNSTSTDAINGSQLYATVDAINKLSAGQNGLDGEAVKYDHNPDGTVNHDKITLEGNPTTITNLADGTQPSDAVNYSQLTTVANQVTNIAEGTDGMFQVNNTSNLPKPKPTGKDSTAGGAGAVASADNSVALGANSVADRANTVSVGAAGSERQIANVAAGTQGTDAVNVSQLKQGVTNANQYTDNKFNSLKNMVDDQNDKLSAGISGAMAMASLPQPYAPGASMVSMGGGTYQGQSAVALGVSTISDNGKWVTKLSGTSTSQGDLGAAVGVGYQW
ncbi:hypothetical protein FH968_10775 [Buttiauxella sp. B2]|uniref:YadA-like family protein n=1 Tax=Buttiauxella sp. B2 TaxID=2587812 RepID=UPI001121A0E1|nr:YadA-like family protein [Buttiauxella sp. B2]TNV20478.1 hypothetical protein FH968_10775 [Buttiauxella sp. B2]